MDSRTLLCTINMQYPWFMGPWAWVLFARIPGLETKHQILLSQLSTQYNPNLNPNHNTSILGEGHPKLKNLHRIEVGASVSHFCLNTWHFCNINSKKWSAPASSTCIVILYLRFWGWSWDCEWPACSNKIVKRNLRNIRRWMEPNGQATGMSKKIKKLLEECNSCVILSFDELL